MEHKKPYPCYCAICEKTHRLAMTRKEWEMLAAIPGTANPKTYVLNIACDSCRPFKHSVSPTPLPDVK